MQMLTICIFSNDYILNSYSQLIVEVANSENINPEPLLSYSKLFIMVILTTQWIHSDFLAHFEELVSEDRVLIYFLFILDSKRLKVLFELN